MISDIRMLHIVIIIKRLLLNDFTNAYMQRLNYRRNGNSLKWKNQRSYQCTLNVYKQLNNSDVKTITRYILNNTLLGIVYSSLDTPSHRYS